MEDIKYQVEIAAAMLRAIHEAMEAGNNELETYLPAVYGVVEFLRQIAADQPDA